METLDHIAIRTGTDKNSNCHNYTQYYEMFFEPLRQRHINVMDMGIYHGDSLRMWRDYFTNAKIYGVDWEDMSQYDCARIQTYICDQTKLEDLHKLMADTPQMDIICDDMGHNSFGQLQAFDVLFRHVAQHGYYIIEDLLCGYFSQWQGQSGYSIITRVKEMIDQVNMGGKVNKDWLCSNKRSEVAKYPDLNKFEREIEWVFNSTGLVIIKKL